jgi:hypothetical protein
MGRAVQGRTLPEHHQGCCSPLRSRLYPHGLWPARYVCYHQLQCTLRRRKNDAFLITKQTAMYSNVVGTMLRQARSLLVQTGLPVQTC